MHLPGMTHGGGLMGVFRDGAPGWSRDGGSAHPALSSRAQSRAFSGRAPARLPSSPKTAPRHGTSGSPPSPPAAGVQTSDRRRAVRTAVRNTRIPKHATCHTFWHSFATHLVEDGYDIRTIQELLDRKDVKTTMIYTHVLNRGGKGVRSPVDAL